MELWAPGKVPGSSYYSSGGRARREIRARASPRPRRDDVVRIPLFPLPEMHSERVRRRALSEFHIIIFIAHSTVRPVFSSNFQPSSSPPNSLLRKAFSITRKQAMQGCVEKRRIFRSEIIFVSAFLLWSPLNVSAQGDDRCN